MIVVKARLTDFNSPVFVVAFYNQPQLKSQLEAELDYLLKTLRLKHKNAIIIVSGDFNRKPHEMTKIVSRLDLKMMQHQDDQFVTHIETRRPHTEKQLDYILSNQTLIAA